MRFSRNRIFSKRLQKLQLKIRVDTQRLREKTLQSLEDLFFLAESMAKNVKVKMKQRQIWARIAAYIAQIINSVAGGFDEKQIDIDLTELGKLIDEARSKAEASAAKEKASDQSEDKSTTRQNRVFSENPPR